MLARNVIEDKNKFTPYSDKGWYLHPVAEEPAEDYHDCDPTFLVDPGIYAVVGDHNVSEKYIYIYILNKFI